MTHASPVAAFETIGSYGGRLPLWEQHMQRLARGAARLDGPPPPADLRDLVLAALAAAPGSDVARVAFAPGQGYAVTVRRRLDSPWQGALRGEPVRVLPVIDGRDEAEGLAIGKVEPRAAYDQALADARLGGADDGLLLQPDGCLRESAVGNLWLLLDSVWTTPPLDGLTVPGIARNLLLDRCQQLQIPVAEAPCTLGDLHRAQAIVLSNAVFGPVVAGLPGQAVEEPHTSLARVWRMFSGG